MDPFSVAYSVASCSGPINGLLFGWFIASAIDRKFPSEFGKIWAVVGAFIGIVLVSVIQKVLFSALLGNPQLWIFVLVGIGTANGWFIGSAIGKKYPPEYAWIWGVAGAVIVTVIVGFSYALLGACC